MCDDGTIGDLSSGATTLASASTSALYTLLWTNFANTEAAVSTGRGASAAADFAAHKTIALPKMLGRVYGIAGAGSGLTSRAMGKTTGTETVTLTQGNLPSGVTLSVVGSLSPVDLYQRRSGGAVSVASGATFSIYPASAFVDTTPNLTGGTVSLGGSSTATNIVQPTVFLKMMVRL